MIKKFIVIPAFNEEKNLIKLINRILDLKIKNLKILIIDDSKKNFENNLKIFKKHVIYFHRGKKLGRGSAVLYGLKYLIKNFKYFEYCIEMDADMSHNPKEIKNKIKKFKNENLDLLISSRYTQNSEIINWPLNRRVLSYLSNKLSSFLLNVPISDYTNGFRLYSYKATKHIVKKCGKIGDGYIVLSEILVQLFYNNFKVSETNTIFVNRIRGKSNVTLNEIIKSLLGLIKIYNLKIKLKDKL